MRPSLALSIAAAFNILIGLPLVLAPAQVLSVPGNAMPTEGLVPARDVGVLLTGVGSSTGWPETLSERRFEGCSGATSSFGPSRWAPLDCHGNTAGLFHTNQKVMAVRAIMTNTSPTTAAIALHVHSWSFIGFT
jgi:hypothetical protein